MTEAQQEVTKSARKPARRRKAVKRAAPKVAKPSGEFDGLTVQDCCKACSAEGCAISGASYCAHPAKGGLQGKDQHNPTAIGRMNGARKHLKLAAATAQFG